MLYLCIGLKTDLYEDMEEIKALTIEELWISPFTARRVYNEDGVLNWVPLERNLHPTGQRHIDFIARSLSEGHSDFGWMARRLGCRREDLWGLVQVLTGMDVREFRLAWMFRLADELLRYTTLSVGEVARLSGFSSASCICQQYKKYRHFSPNERRRALRREHDAGRYRV